MYCTAAILDSGLIGLAAATLVANLLISSHLPAWPAPASFFLMFTMARGFVFTSFVSLLSCFANLRVQAVACYYPNGELSPNDTPCYNNRAVSVCCGQGYACLDNGICKVVIDTNVANDIQYLRGSCTDQLFGPGCPQFCIGSQC